MTDKTEPTMTPEEVAAGLNRRRVLGLTAGAAALLLAGCGSDSGTNTAEPGTESSKSEPTADGDSSAPATGGALAATADVPVGSGVILEAEKIVVTQPTAGEFKGFSAICPHQSCTVGSIKGKTISCPCHGSSFAIADGAVITGPASRPLDEVKVKVEGDKIVKA